MIPADILTVLLILGLAVAPAWLVLRSKYRAGAPRRAQQVEP